jgi:hypothetical protein
MLACCRRHEAYFAHDAVREAIAAIAAHFADPLAPDAPFEGDHLRDLGRRVQAHADEQDGAINSVASAVLTAVEPRSITLVHGYPIVFLVYDCFHEAAEAFYGEGNAEELEAQAVLVREVVGNPYRPVTIKPEWRTATVMTLARQMYAAEEFSAMPILADALQDAGCDNDALLTHCRDPNQPHVRGCWVIDLLLEKE